MSSNLLAHAILVDCLMRDAYSIPMLQEQTGMGWAAIKRSLELLMAHPRRTVRISEWHKGRNGKDWVAHYELNPDGLMNARKPRNKTAVERVQKYRLSKKAKALGVPLAVLTEMKEKEGKI
jgi:hypothetical protein